MNLPANTSLQSGKYRIIRTLGQGGFGITYEAEQVLLHRKVALKEFFMKDCCERDTSTSQVSVGTGAQRDLVNKFRGKFIREAQMIAELDHPHIVRVLDVFEENGTAYYVMDYLPGGSLADKVRREGPLPEDRAEEYIRQVSGALSCIHARNTVHLDVKPSNILLNAKEQAVLIDFGISKHYDAAGEQTSSTPVGLSKGYAPLEQGRDGDVSQFKPSTDIYALGATLYHLVTGLVPPEASIVNEDGLERPAGISDRVWHVIERSMQPRRKDRPQSIAEFLSLWEGSSSATRTDDSDSTIVPPVPRPRPEPEPAPNPAPEPHPTPAPGLKMPKTWLWALLAGVVATVVVLALILGGNGKNGKDGSGVAGSIKGHEWVDLGLSVKWATCNVGATQPEEYGDYFAWGETKPKSEYTWENYKFRVSGSSYKNVTFSKYNAESERDTVDDKERLDMSDDAARANLGGTWRMPTRDEWAELGTECTWTWTTQGGKNGYKVTSKTNGNSIFLPAAGDRRDADLNDVGSYGEYWSSSLNTDYPYRAYFVYFNSDSCEWYGGSRFLGLSVRPVSE